MHVLLDEQLPRQLAEKIDGHQVTTVERRGWKGMKNGELPAQAAADGFDVFVTSDQNLEFQQNLSQSDIGVVVLHAASNALEDLLPLVPQILAIIPTTRPGAIVHVAA